MISRLIGPVDRGLALAVASYVAGYFGMKVLHERLMRNLIAAEVEAYLKSHVL